MRLIKEGSSDSEPISGSLSGCVIPIWLYLVSIGLLLSSANALSDNNAEPRHFWTSVDLGLGHVERSVRGTKEGDDNMFLGFTLGYLMDPRFLVGIEMSGWLIEPSNFNYPERGGEGLSQVLLTTRYYPSRDSSVFFDIGGGYLSHWNNRPAEPRRMSGWGLIGGVGYAVSLASNWDLTPFLKYSFGELDDEELEAFTVGVGFMWRPAVQSPAGSPAAF